MGKRRKRLTMPKYAKKYASVIAHINKLKGNVTEAVEEIIEEVVEEINERLPNGLVTMAEPTEKPVFASREVGAIEERPQPRKPRKSRRNTAAKPKVKETNTS